MTHICIGEYIFVSLHQLTDRFFSLMPLVQSLVPQVSNHGIKSKAEVKKVLHRKKNFPTNECCNIPLLNNNTRELKKNHNSSLTFWFVSGIEV